MNYFEAAAPSVAEILQSVFAARSAPAKLRWHYICTCTSVQFFGVVELVDNRFIRCASSHHDLQAQALPFSFSVLLNLLIRFTAVPGSSAVPVHIMTYKLLAVFQSVAMLFHQFWVRIFGKLKSVMEQSVAHKNLDLPTGVTVVVLVIG